MVIVEAEDHLNNTKSIITEKRITRNPPHKLSLSMPRYLDQWIQENGGYKKIIQEILENITPCETLKLHPVGVHVTSADYKFVVKKSKQLGMPLAVLIRYLITTYYEDYLNSNHRKTKLKANHNVTALIYKQVHEEIRQADVINKQLYHYCIRQYNDHDEEFLKKYYDRKKTTFTVPYDDYMKLKQKGNINQVMVDNVVRLYDESLY